MDSVAKTKYEALFRKYPVAISHLHQQFEVQRLGLVLGAGIGKELGFPNWEELIRNIAETPEVEGLKLYRNPSARTITSQMLFQLFKEKFLKSEEGRQSFDRYGDLELRKKWKVLVHDVLYRGASPRPDDWTSSCPYLENLVKVIGETGTMTVTYNFDDTIEKLLYKYNKTRGSRGFTVVWDSNVQMEKRDNIVYHPNGYLPRKMSDFASTQLVFLEDTFEDQLLDSFNGHYNALNNHYSSRTCLFLGISLEDRNLKHMLRVNAKKCFGHIHYIVQHMPNHDNDSDESQQLIVDSETRANFNTYNLYTMYLTSDEINILMEMLLLKFDDFNSICIDVIKTRKFFVMGSVAAGKSTAVSQFKCFQTYDEWLDDMPDDMDKAPSELENDKVKAIDTWISEQIWRKNDNLVKTTTNNLPCISIIDRTPIDAYAFFDNDLVSPDGIETSEDKKKRIEKLNISWKEKARLHLSQKTVGSSLTGGKIIFLQGEIPEMVKRAKQKFRGHEDRDLHIQQDELLYLARGACKMCGENTVNIINVTNKSIEQVAKEIAEVIYFSEYTEVDFQRMLDAIADKGREFYEE